MAAISVAIATQACVVREAPPVNAGYYPTGRPSGASVATPQPYAVSTMPPEPLYEQMTASPGYGYVWIDGSWHWNGYEWVWVSGRWEQDQSGQVYVQPYYDYSGDTYIYTPGYWSSRERLPRGAVVRDHRDGRPTYYAPTPGPRPRPTSPSEPYRPQPSPREPYRPQPSPTGPRRPYDPNVPAREDNTTRQPRSPSSGPITSPPYDPEVGGTYRPGRGTDRPVGGQPTPPPYYGPRQPPSVPVGGQPTPPPYYGPRQPPVGAPPAGYAPQRGAPPPAGAPATRQPPPARGSAPPPPPARPAPATTQPPVRGRR